MARREGSGLQQKRAASTDVSTIPQLTKIWSTTTNTCPVCRKSCDENYEHGPNKASDDRANENQLFHLCKSVSSRGHSFQQTVIAAFPCLQTKSRCEPRSKFIHQICATYRFPQRCVIMAFANSCCQYITRWSSSLNTLRA